MFSSCVPTLKCERHPQLHVLDSAKMRKVWNHSVCCFCIFLSAIYAGAQTALPTPALTSDLSASVKPAQPAETGGDSVLRLGTGDLIEVSVYNVPDLSTKTRVGSAGDIYLPLVDYVHVAGLTINEAEAVIEKRLDQGGFVKNPHVHLFVDEYTSAGASVLGEVARPGVYPVLGDQRLFDLISAAGGFNMARKVAACCEFFNIRTAWHGPGNVSPVGHAVNMHLDLASYNFGIQEQNLFSAATREVFPGAPEIRVGYMYANDKPGLGIDIDERAAAKFPYKGSGGSRGNDRRLDGTIVRP